MTKKERGGKFLRAGVLGEEMGGAESHSGEMREERLSTDPSRRGEASAGGMGAERTGEGRDELEDEAADNPWATRAGAEHTALCSM